MLVDQLFSTPGLLSSSAALDLFLALLTAALTKKLLLPAFRAYNTCRVLNHISQNKKGHWFYGHLHVYPQSQKGLRAYTRDMHMFPAMFNYWIGPFLALMQTHHPDVVLPILSTAAPKAKFAYDFVRPWVGDGLLTSSGKKWKRNRKLLTPAFHFTVLKQYMAVFNGCAAVMLDKWSRMTRDAIDVSSHLNLMTLDVILRCAMSTVTDCQLESVTDNSYIQAVHDVSEAIVKRIDQPLFQIDWIFKLTELGRRFYRALDVMHSKTEQIIRERQARSDSKLSDNQIVDFLHILIHTKDEDGKGLTDREIRDEVDTFLFEGHDTTSSGMSFFLYNMASNPQIQDKCRDEICKVLGDRANVKWSDLPNFQYLAMCIKESLRLHPPVYVIGRTLDQPIKVKSDFLPKPNATLPPDSNIMINIYAQHHNSAIWKNPDKFIPERFSKENLVHQSPHAFIPFSAGPRNCIGQNFAMNEMKVIAALTLRRFHLSIDGTCPAPVVSPMLVLRSQTGLFVKLTPVDSDHSDMSVVNHYCS